MEVVAFPFVRAHVFLFNDQFPLTSRDRFILVSVASGTSPIQQDLVKAWARCQSSASSTRFLVICINKPCLRQNTTSHSRYVHLQSCLRPLSVTSQPEILTWQPPSVTVKKMCQFFATDPPVVNRAIEGARHERIGGQRRHLQDGCAAPDLHIPVLPSFLPSWSYNYPSYIPQTSPWTESTGTRRSS